MRGILSGQRGLAPAVLVLVIAWALAAVLELTGTLLAANRIDDSVKIIKPEVSNIGTNSEAIALAARTTRISAKIRVAAAPLTGELADTLAAAKDIDTVAKSILVKAGAINATASSINGNVKLINGTVNSISGNADSINSNVRSINRNASSRRTGAVARSSSPSAVNTAAPGMRLDFTSKIAVIPPHNVQPCDAGHREPIGAGLQEVP